MELRDILAIKKAIDSLGEGELKPYLRFILVKIKLMKEQEGTLETTVTELIELYDELMGLQEKRAVWYPVPACTHVHIVVGDSFAGSMKQALKGLGWAETHKLITLRENYAIGPLDGLDSPEGRRGATGSATISRKHSKLTLNSKKNTMSFWISWSKFRNRQK